MSEYQPQKLQQESIRPKEIKKAGNKELRIVWSDGHASSYSFRYLRQNCQCALCVDEMSGKIVLEREKVPESIEGVKVNLVGQYAVRVDFSDGHSTGIYAFKHLRKICQCEGCGIVRQKIFQGRSPEVA